MKIERLSRKESIEAMHSWMASSFTPPSLGRDYSEIRSDLVSLYNQSKQDANRSEGYALDVHFGAALFLYLRTKSWFTDRLASDDGFWRYMSLRVVPDLVGERWGNNNADHYYTKPSRIWLKTLWWYYYLSLKNSDAMQTKTMLLSDVFSTDTVLNLVERTGRSGTNISVYRAIMSKYSTLSDVKDKDFRNVMKLNTAKAVVLEPVFCIGGINGYVNSLFNELSINE